MYLVIHNDTGQRQRIGHSWWGSLISTHRTLNGALRSFKRRNWWFYNKSRARRAGLENCYTFDTILEVDKDNRILHAGLEITQEYYQEDWGDE